jgi:hypothetical protein
MPTVAEQLRQGREALKLDVHQVAEATKLKTDMSGRWSRATMIISPRRFTCAVRYAPTPGC